MAIVARTGSVVSGPGLIAIQVRVVKGQRDIKFQGNISIFWKANGASGTRRAKPDEVEVRLQDTGGLTLADWRTIAQTKTDTSAGGYSLVQKGGLDPGNYRIAARHIASNAEYGKTFEVKSDGLIGTYSNTEQINPGEEMASFKQGRPSGGFAFPEAGIWPASGTNPALPGVRYRVRQDGYGYRYPII